MEDGCPKCGITKTTDHIFQCRSKVSEDVMRTQAEILHMHLQDTTNKQVWEVIMELVRAFHEEREPIQTNALEETYARIMKKQFAMGQRAFLGGMWVKESICTSNTLLENKKTEVGKEMYSRDNHKDTGDNNGDVVHTQ